MKKKELSSASLEEDNHLHLVAKLAIADPKVIAQALLYESEHNEKDVLVALARLIEANRNESGKNIASYVATANIEVNSVKNYLFDEDQFAKEVCSHLSKDQIDRLLQYNTAKLENPEPCKEIQLIREVFGSQENLKPGEGNSFLKAFLEQGKTFAGDQPLEVPQSKPEIKAIKGSTMAICMLSMCVSQGFLPLRRHDGSHINSGFDNTVKGEIYNQTHDLGQNSLAQYGVVPTLEEQRLNRKIIYSFQGLPQKLKGLKRDWRAYVSNALEAWRSFLLENPEYVEKWKLTGLVDDQMRMIKSDGYPIISTQTKEQQIPVIDYTDLSVIHYLKKKLNGLLTDEEVYSALPYDELYTHALQSIDLLALEYILRDGKPPVMINGMLDSNATYKDVRYGHFHGRPELSDLSSDEHRVNFQNEVDNMEKRRADLVKEGKWSGYLVDLGQDDTRCMWVTEKPPALSVIYPGALTVHRIVLPQDSIRKAQANTNFFEGNAYLVDGSAIQIESELSIRDESRISCIEGEKTSRLERMQSATRQKPLFTLSQ